MSQTAQKATACGTCGGSKRKPILVCTYGHAVVWGGAPDVSWEGETCNYGLLCGAAMKDSGETAPCPDCRVKKA